eukprot:1852954-Pyramimonas_sp.AAC.2
MDQLLTRACHAKPQPCASSGHGACATPNQVSNVGSNHANRDGGEGARDPCHGKAGRRRVNGPTAAAVRLSVCARGVAGQIDSMRCDAIGAAIVGVS